MEWILFIIIYVQNVEYIPDDDDYIVVVFLTFPNNLFLKNELQCVLQLCIWKTHFVLLNIHHNELLRLLCKWVGQLEKKGENNFKKKNLNDEIV